MRCPVPKFCTFTLYLYKKRKGEKNKKYGIFRSSVFYHYATIALSPHLVFLPPLLRPPLVFYPIRQFLFFHLTFLNCFLCKNRYMLCFVSVKELPFFDISSLIQNAIYHFPQHLVISSIRQLVFLSFLFFVRAFVAYETAHKQFYFLRYHNPRMDYLHRLLVRVSAYNSPREYPLHFPHRK